METHWRREHWLSGEYIMQCNETKIIDSLKKGTESFTEGEYVEPNEMANPPIFLLL